VVCGFVFFSSESLKIGKRPKRSLRTLYVVFSVKATLRVIVRENRAVPKDWGQPISFSFSAFKTKLKRLTLVTLTKFSRRFSPGIDHSPSF